MDWRAADAADPEAAADAAKGASVIYQCLNAPYTQWPERFPPLQRGVLAAAERTGALLVSLENLYGYGPAGGKPMTEDLPLAATGVKGRARAAMTAELLAAAAPAGSASPSAGPRTSSAPASPRAPRSASGSSATPWPGGAPTSSATPACRTPTATSRTSPPAWPPWAPTPAQSAQVWHLPGPATGTTRALLDLVAGQVGHPVAVRSLSKLAVRALGLVNPTLRELAEISYQFDEPFVLDTSKYESAFGAAGTPLADAIAATVAWYRTRPGTP